LKKLYYFAIKSLLGIIGFFSLLISIVSIALLVKYAYFSEVELVGRVFNSEEYCSKENLSVTTRTNCSIYMTINWLIVATISSIVLSFITLFPFFMMKKNIQT